MAGEMQPHGDRKRQGAKEANPKNASGHEVCPEAAAAKQLPVNSCQSSVKTGQEAGDRKSISVAEYDTVFSRFFKRRMEQAGQKHSAHAWKMTLQEIWQRAWERAFAMAKKDMAQWLKENGIADVSLEMGGNGRARYALRKELGVWRLVYDGQEGYIEDGQGIKLAAYLIYNPPPGGIHGTHLGEAVFKHVVVESGSLGSSSDPLRRKMLKEAGECKGTLENPTASEMAKDEARTKLAELASLLNFTGGNGHGSVEKQVRAYRRAIERLITKLVNARDRQGNPHPALKAFGEHLQKHLWNPSCRYSGQRQGRNRTETVGMFTYERPTEITWEE
jgi:hypothetical protein